MPHLLTNFQIKKYYKNEPRFNGVYSRNILPKIKDGVYVTNLDKYKSMENHWIALYVKDDNVTYCNYFVAEHIPKKLKHLLEKKCYKKYSWHTIQ